MSRSFLAILAIVLMLTASVRADQFAAGAATCDITPPVGYPMWGYASRKDAPSQGVLDPLQARAVVIAVGTERLAIVSLDLGRVPTRAHMAVIRQRIQSAGIAHVMLVASHTHHGPVLELDSWPDPKNSYTQQLDAKLVEAIFAAAKNLKPARWGTASRELALNRNRQSKLSDPPVDRGLTVLRLEGLDGQPIAHLVNFAAHPTMIDAKILKFSADYPGALAATVEKETNVPCLFLQGAAGDLSPQVPAGLKGHVAFGNLLGREIVDLTKSIACPQSTSAKLKISTEGFKFKPRLDVSNPLIRGMLERAFFPDLVAFFEREYREGVRPELITAVLDDRIGFVGVSGEFFCSHALNLRRRARLEQLFFFSFCNDYQQYFPTIEAVAEGGYGTAPPVAMAEIGAGEKVTNRALIHLYQLRGRLAE